MAGDQAKHGNNPGSSPEGEAFRPASGREGEASADPGRVNWASWSRLWQMPSIIAGLTLITLGVYSAIDPRAGVDLDAALRQVESLIDRGELEPAEDQLRNVVEPHIAGATEPQQASFHAAVADLIASLSSGAPASISDVRSKHISENYAKAAELGGVLTPVQLKRWALADLDVGDMAGARKRLAALDAKVGAGRGHDATVTAPRDGSMECRNEVFRRIIEHDLRRPDLDSEAVHAALIDYRAKSALRAEDDIWAAARLAELRLATRDPQAAIDALMVDVRRLENKGLADSDAIFGELLGLLGRGYAELGQYDRAAAHLERSLQLLPPTDPVRAEVLLTMGRVAAATNDHDGAFELFDQIVQNFADTPAYPQALLERAFTLSVVGEHDRSLGDYDTLRELLSRNPATCTVAASRVSESLSDRHDASLAQGNLEIARQYAALAERLFDPKAVPAEILLRLASVNRQIATDLLASIPETHNSQEADADTGEVGGVAIRHKANGHHEQAAQYYMRHQAALLAKPGDSADSKQSLWLAADSADLAGRRDWAVPWFLEYVKGSSQDDSRRPAAMFRLAQACQAERDYAAAAEHYRRLAEEHPRSIYVFRSYVPLARCYAALNRPQEAVLTLNQVLAGDSVLDPDAQHYRDALIELGRFHYHAGEFTQAIERLTEAWQRYQDEPSRMDILFMLADSHRGRALAVAGQMSQPALSSAERAALDASRRGGLETAQDLFSQLIELDHSSLLDGVPRNLSETQAENLRRAHIYRADCAFDLGRHGQAVELYDRMARLYGGHQSSMYALVQVVNCYSAMGEPERAAAAHHRALVRLKQLPETAFSALDTLMDRAAWERWLENNPIAPPLHAQVSAPPQEIQ